MKVSFAVLGLCLLGCRSQRGAEHLRNELSFVVPYVDVAEEERAVRASLAQRKLMVDEVQRAQWFVALSAATLGQDKSAVRIISPRGVVLGEDADERDLFAARRVELLSALTPSHVAQPMFAVRKLARGVSQGCVEVYRLIGDGRVLRMTAHLERFGSRVCISDIEPTAAGRFRAQLSFPSLHPDAESALYVELYLEEGRLDQPDVPKLSLRLSEDSWAERETSRLAALQTGGLEFAALSALGVSRAALSHAKAEGTDTQLAAYRNTVGRTFPGSPEAAQAALVSKHIQDGFLDAELVPDAGEVTGTKSVTPAAGEGADEVVTPEDALVIEPAP